MKRKLLKVTLALMATAWVGGVQAQDLHTFGSEQVVDEETTWVFNGYSNGDLGNWDATNSTYPVTNKLYARRYSSRKFTIAELAEEKELVFSDGYHVKVTKVANGAAGGAAGTGNGVATANSSGTSGNDNIKYVTPFFAFNASIAGTCYVYFSGVIAEGTTKSSKCRIYYNKLSDSEVKSNKSVETTTTEPFEVSYTLNEPGSFFIGSMDNTCSIYAIRFVPTEGKADKIVYIGATGYATFGNNTGSHLDIPSGLTAYAAKPGTNSVTLTALQGIPQMAGVVLKGTPYTNYSLKASSSTYSDNNNYMQRVPKDNQLAQTTDNNNDGNADHWNYILVNDNDKPKFFLVDGTSTIAKDKAYLSSNKELKAAAGSRGFSIIFADEATGIEAVTTQQVDDQWYNLQGQKVAQPAKGLFIKNGKKVIIK